MYKMDNMNGLKRSVFCGDLRAANIGEEVTVCGWKTTSATFSPSVRFIAGAVRDL